MKTAICIFARPPLPGKAKTRLIPALGKAGAANLARALLKDVVNACEQVGDAQLVISTTAYFITENGLPIWIQPEGDLGLRLEKTIQRGLLSADCVIAVGADTPGLRASMLTTAIQKLQQKGAVLGPTEDGGYYLVGLRRCPDGVFENIRWSSPETLEDTLLQFGRFGIECAIKPRWFDLDTPADLERVRLLIHAGMDMGPNLAMFLNSAALREEQYIR